MSLGLPLCIARVVFSLDLVIQRFSLCGVSPEPLTFRLLYSGMRAHKSSPGINSVVTLILD